MGGKSWSSTSYSHISTAAKAKTQSQIFTQKTVSNLMSPKGIKWRESRDSQTHPNSVAIIVALDETGSMGDIPEIMVKEKLGPLMETLIKHGVADAHVMFMGVGDQYSDDSPLQVGQFEAGTTELNEWLTKIYLEGNGGGQGMESYQLPWLFAGRHTSIDCFEKRNEKGFLFTIGDEEVHTKLEASKIEEIMGYKAEDVSSEQLLKEAQRTYNVFHIHVNHGYRGRADGWKKLLGERLIVVDDYNTIAETIATTVAVMRGANIKSVTSQFDKGIANSVTTALAKVDMGVSKAGSGIVKL